MSKAIHLLSQITLQIERAFFALGMIAFVGIGVVTLADVALRYGLARPIPWAYSVITYYLMVCALVLPLAATQYVREHISIDIIRRHLPEVWGNAIDAITLLLGALVCGYVASIVFTQFLGSFAQGSRIAGENWMLIWPSHLLVAGGFGVFAFRLLLQAAEAAVGQSSFQPHEPASGE